MITAKNYAAQAERGLRSYADNLLRLKSYEFYEEDAKVAIILANAIKKSIHFAIPDGGYIFDDNLKGMEGVQARMPYPLMTIEYHVREDQAVKTDKTPIHSPKRLVLTIERDIKKIKEYLHKENSIKKLEYFEELNSKINTIRDDIATGIYVVCEVNGHWLPCPMSWLLPSTWDSSYGEQVNVIGPLSTRSELTSKIVGMPEIAFPGYYKAIENEIGEDAFQYCINDISGEMSAVLELCEALTCSNVSTEIFQEEREKTNAKREKKGKLPFYETKTLSIVVPNNNSSNNTNIKYGDRSSPRQHLRRGHIRKLSNNNKIWVNSCVVGSANNGRIDKDYSVFA